MFRSGLMGTTEPAPISVFPRKGPPAVRNRRGKWVYSGDYGAAGLARPAKGVQFTYTLALDAWNLQRRLGPANLPRMRSLTV